MGISQNIPRWGYMWKRSIVQRWIQCQMRGIGNSSFWSPYNADFDGDETNLHVPQSLPARTEAELMIRQKRRQIQWYVKHVFFCTH